MNHHDFDWAAMADALELEGDTYTPYITAALAELDELRPARVLDVGSGPGVASCLLARRFPEAEVVAVDGSAELLERARGRAERMGVALRTLTAEFPAGLSALPEADLIWSAQVIHHVGDQLDALRRLAALLRPGGMVAITEGGLPARWLPRDIGIGRPGFQTRLDVAQDDAFHGMRAELPHAVAVTEDWPSLLRAAGLVDARSHSFLIDHPAPLADGPRAWVRQTLEHRRHRLSDVLAADDAATLARLLDPADPASIDQRPDLFVLSAKTVHFARKP